ncbi:hypothetical protein Y695_00029 [Hydrogenophaga sp. T4]|nr:hypothetical protein Y695_00029 [Hydrogenophaga sp. T4]
MRTAPTATLMAKLRRQAKQAVREGHTTHCEELDRLAQAQGFPSWRELQAAATPFDLPVDPPLRKFFDQTPNEERSQHELDTWWDRPYAVTCPDGHFEVRCLDGGAWDRSTCYGAADTIDEARVLAQRKLKAWQSLSSGPTAMLLGDGQAQAVVMPRRPGEAARLYRQSCRSARLVRGWSAGVRRLQASVQVSYPPGRQRSRSQKNEHVRTLSRRQSRDWCDFHFQFVIPMGSGPLGVAPRPWTIECRIPPLKLATGCSLQLRFSRKLLRNQRPKVFRDFSWRPPRASGWCSATTLFMTRKSDPTSSF